MKKGFGLFVVFSAACGTQGDLGKARFHVGDNWDNHAQVAVGSQFQFEANHGFFSERLILQSQDAERLAIEGDRARAIKEGSISIEAHDIDDGLIDIFHLKLVEATSMELRNPIEPNNYWSDSLPETFAIVEDSQTELYIAMLDDSLNPLYHDNALRVEGEDNWIISLGHYGDTLRLHSRQEGQSNLKLQSNQGLEQNYSVEVIDRDDISSMMVRLSPNVNRIPKVNEELSSSSRFDSMVYVSVDARTRDHTPVLLPEGSVSVIGDEDASITMGATGFWINAPSNEAISVQIQIGNMLGFAYID